MQKPPFTPEAVADILVDCFDAISYHRAIAAGDVPAETECIMVSLMPAHDATKQLLDWMKDCPRRQALKALLRPDQELITVLMPTAVAEIADTLRNEGFAVEADAISEELDRADEERQRGACAGITRH